MSEVSDGLGGEPLALGPVLLAEQRLRPGGCSYAAAGSGMAAGLVAFYFLLEGRIAWAAPAPCAQCGPGAVLLLDLDARWSFAVEAPVRLLCLLAPRSFLSPVLPGRIDSGPLPGGAGLDLVRGVVADLLLLDRSQLSPATAERLALALRELLAAAAAPVTGATAALAQRRDATLLDRATAHIDAHLADPLDADRLCRALACSRSTLYRAVALAGGITELIARRRLAAVHAALRDPAETRAIAQLARDHGLVDPVQFSRRFKRAFGTTARQVRLRADPAPGAMEPPPFDPLHGLSAAATL